MSDHPKVGFKTRAYQQMFWPFLFCLGFSIKQKRPQWIITLNLGNPWILNFRKTSTGTPPLTRFFYNTDFYLTQFFKPQKQCRTNFFYLTWFFFRKPKMCQNNHQTKKNYFSSKIGIKKLILFQISFWYFKILHDLSIELALISYVKGMQDCSALSIVLFKIYISTKLLKKRTLEMKKSHFSVLVLPKLLLLWHGFSLAQKTLLKKECLYLVLRIFLMTYVLSCNLAQKVRCCHILA